MKKTVRFGSQGAVKDLLKNVRDYALATPGVEVSEVEKGSFTVTGEEDTVNGLLVDLVSEHGIWYQIETPTNAA